MSLCKINIEKLCIIVYALTYTKCFNIYTKIFFLFSLIISDY